MYKTAQSLNLSPAIRHGFFGSQGGVSTGPFCSLNAADDVGDEQSFVLENRRRALQALGQEGQPLFMMKQVHGRDVYTLTASNLEASLRTPPLVDGVVTKLSHIFLGVNTADCAPLLWVDPDASVIGACHAGWRGALGGIIEETLKKMQDLGAEKKRIHVAIGPMIHQKSYEVGQEFYAQFLENAPLASPFFQKKNDKYLFDLREFICEKIRNLEIKMLACLPYNTFEPAFFSYRRATLQGNGVCGRNLSLIQSLSQKNLITQKL